MSEERITRAVEFVERLTLLTDIALMVCLVMFAYAAIKGVAACFKK